MRWPTFASIADAHGGVPSVKELVVVSVQNDTTTGKAEVELGQAVNDACSADCSAQHENTTAAAAHCSEDDDSAEPEAASDKKAKAGHRINWSRLVAFGVLPLLAVLLAGGAGFFKWQYTCARNDGNTRVDSVQAARNSTIAMLSYQPDKVDQQLGAARNLLTGPFRDSYTSLTHDVVIPGAKQKRISATASVPAAASVSGNWHHAVALLFVNQTVVMGTDAPTDTASSVRVTLDKIDGHWLISGFEPV
jgi:Mce-associated membrane protein